MPGMQYIIDPDAAPFVLGEENGISIFSPVKSTPAQTETLWTSNIDTEGELVAGGKTGNAEITPRMRLIGSTEEEFRERQIQLDSKIDKLKREGGVLRIIFPDESFIDWEVRDVTGGERLMDNRFVHHMRTEDEITFVTAPYGEGEEELLGTFDFVGSPTWLLEAVAEVGGTAPARARAVITSPEADLWDLKWGRESQRYSADATALLYYDAQELMALGGATKTTATVDDEEGTPVLRQGTLPPNYQAMFSTQIEGVGQMTHEGVFEALVWVHMPATNTGEVGAVFEYGVGDMVRRTTNAETLFEADHSREGKVICLSAGEVRLRATEQGTHQWEGRLNVKSTATGDDFDVLGFGLRPLGEGNGTVAVKPTLVVPASVTTRDGFGQAEGNLNGQIVASAAELTGPNSPGTVADNSGIGTLTWSNPSYAKSDDENRATVEGNAPDISHYLLATDFGFELPEGATVEGVEPEVKRSSTGSKQVDGAARLVIAGVIQATDHSAGGYWRQNVDIYKTYGGPSNLLGAPLTYSDINHSGFGWALAVKFVDGAPRQAHVNHIRMKVYWADAGGQKWVTTGDAVDLKVISSSHVAQRTEVSDADIDTGRYAVAGLTSFTDTVVGIECKRAASAAGANERVRQLVLARYINENNWLGAGFDFDNSSAPATDSVRVFKRVSGTVTELGKLVIPENTDWRGIWLDVDSRGRFFVWVALAEGAVAELLLAGVDSELATGGTLASGKTGFYDAKTGATANTRQYDNFNVRIPPLDAITYEGLSMELSHRAAEREAQGGGIWTKLTPEGSYLKLAPEGLEGRKNRLAFVASPNDPETMGVGFPKKLKVALYGTPRFRTVPDPV